ncbi:MAG: Pectate lyase [Phycisphaerales bacterium]|nr:Pectate lyase [Phycisphaerales bacterium]
MSHPDFAVRSAVALSLLAAAAASPAATTYYVSTTGNDSAAGALATPFATLTKAISKAVAGDTILMRGGTYTLSSTVSIGSTKNGTAAAPYTIANFTGETPVLDFTPQAAGARGVQLDGNYWNIRGLTVANAKDNGINISGSNNLIDRVVLHNNQDSGLQISASGTRTPSNNLIVNSDSYANYDPANHGENADGFVAKFRGLGAGNVFRGVRAWGNSDDGFDFWGAESGVTVENSMSFKNGFNTFSDTAWAGDGNGLKLGHDSGTHVLRNNLIWGNRLNGIDVNGNALDDVGPNVIAHGVTIQNNTAYNNGAGGNGYNYNFDEAFAHVLKNNIALLGGSGNANIYAGVVSDHNSYNAGLGVTAADFLSLSDAIAIGPRQADGSLPYSDFLRLTATSDAIDKGVNVGLAYNGAAPDLGAYEVPEPAALGLMGLAGIMAARRHRR